MSLDKVVGRLEESDDLFISARKKFKRKTDLVLHQILEQAQGVHVVAMHLGTSYFKEAIIDFHKQTGCLILRAADKARLLIWVPSEIRHFSEVPFYREF